ncbi:phytanoyl-CoA dioxygenase family protein [Streptomyces sp. NPDC017248]|uniref:phytanoyl-CoA dioxygenase family protein n=1 Tax=unclassified Streptomyces TaxID=2593676 RepID=UPI003799451C
MQLNDEQVRRYRERGFLLVESVFQAAELDALRAAFDRDSRIPGDQRILEERGDTVRAVYSSHLRQPEFAALVRTGRLLAPVRRLLGRDVYLFQFKVNAKPPFTGEQWAWHQDFLAWRLADNLPEPRLVNVGVFLDDVTEFNGPVIFVPGSHRAGLVGDGQRRATKSAQHLDPDDISLTPAQLAGLVRGGGMESPKGPAGSVVFFDPEIVHGSAPNMSPFPRKLLIATYNAVGNEPRPVGEPRPDYLICRDNRPLRVSDEPLVGAGRGGHG